MKNLKSLSFLLLFFLSIQTTFAQMQKTDSLLFVAVEANNFEQTKLLIEKGANINICDRNDYLPLHMALQHRNKRTAKLLIKKGSKIRSENCFKETPLHIASYFKNSMKIVKLLLNKQVDINAKDRYGNTALHEALRNNNNRVAKLLIKNGVDINAKLYNTNDSYGKPGYTALHFAIENNNNKLAKLLIKSGADINAKISDKDKYYAGYTPLQ